jgi:hypothetical protein
MMDEYLPVNQQERHPRRELGGPISQMERNSGTQTVAKSFMQRLIAFLFYFRSVPETDERQLTSWKVIPTP